MVTTVTRKCNQVTNTHKMKGVARKGNSAMGRKWNTNKGTGRQGKHKQSNGRQKGTWCGNTEGRGKGLEENNKQKKKSYDMSRGVTKIHDITVFPP